MTHELRPRWVLAALLGGGIAWTLHLAASYALVALGCATGWGGTGLLLGGLTVVCGALAVATGITAYRARRSVAAAADPTRFALDVGIGLAALFAILIGLGGIIPLVVPLCPASP